MKPRKKIAYVSGTRADFGLMTSVLKAIDRSKKLDLQIYATGIHLMPEFGKTIRHIKNEFPRVGSVNAVFKTDNRMGMSKFTGEFLKKLVTVFEKNRPDFVLTLGDRPEMLCTAIACLYLGIPTGQIHGGDKTSTVDELARHAITKLSHIHFPATEGSAERIRKMGEEVWRIHVVGAPALDMILNEKLPTRKELFTELGINPNQKVILVTQHPVSEEIEDAERQMEETLAAVKKFKLPVVITYPHADAGVRRIMAVINREKSNPLFKIIPSLPYKQFLALEREAAVWIGNSSGALIESSSFRTPVVNIGTRQLGRQRGDNVMDVGYNTDEIKTAIYKSLYDKKYLAKLAKITNPWGDGKTGPRVAKILESITIDARLLTKQIAY
ncbi:MAG: UDP-N-acetylglucosamine 2-epimerase [Candidatus Taylorbacteria bacterium]|nr:UDP-N-acetylglucosamine 2-epimerase [Candidatus Taylorbacteria bacterium]